ncbi:MAG: hypothetical protein P9M07_00875 [Candidatus Aceula meridiana]|nr:hypothetical protein [Candidatus Aceula meridiana]
MHFNKMLCCFIFCLFVLGGLSFAEEQPFVYDDHGRRDPFWSLISPSGTILSYDVDLDFSDLTLGGVTYDPRGKSVAIINSTIVRTNKEVGGYKVIEIKKTEVILQKDGKMYTLRMRKER